MNYVTNISILQSHYIYILLFDCSLIGEVNSISSYYLLIIKIKKRYGLFELLINNFIFDIMLLSKVIKKSFSFNLLKTLKEVKDAIQAPIKHIKAATEPTGNYYSVQTNTTEEAFDEVSS